ncbi:hypothetical protein, partial [Ruegeria profundi]|uniref:hypothetical protein n=1 Tax=Ruegeria profundi TaxID=1685378 RepID=UPI001CD7AD6E
GQADDLGAGFEILERGGIGHGQKLRNTPAPLKQHSSDKTNSLFIAGYQGNLTQSDPAKMRH